MSILHHTTAKLLSFVVILSLLFISSAAALAENQSTPLPTWTKGQIWAVGGERDLSNVLGENLGTLQDTLTALGNISMDTLQVTGSAGAWAVFKVTEVGQENYLLAYSVGIRIQVDLDVALSGNLPVEGNYLVANMTTENKVVSGNVNLDFVMTSHGIATVEKSTMAIIGVVSTSVLDEHLTVDASNFPNYSTSMSIRGISVNMTYENYAIDESLHLKLVSSMDFAPALPLMQFPLTVGNNWTVDSNMTFAGSVEGYFNATGLPASVTSAFDDDNGAFTGSVRIQDLTKLGTMELNNGTIDPFQQNMNSTMQCIGTKSILDATGNSIMVFDVKEKQSGAHLFYSPTSEFLATAAMKPQLDMLNGVMELPGNSATAAMDLNTEISMASADPATATDKIAQICVYQGVESVSLVSSSSPGSESPASDSTIMILSAVAIAVIAAGVGGVLLLRKQKKKSL